MEYHRINSDFVEIAAQVEALRAAGRGSLWRNPFSVMSAPLRGKGRAASHGAGFRLSAKAMPDAWLQAVAELPEISEQGLKRLAEPLKTRGFVSVRDAIAFVKIERAGMEAIIRAESAAESKRKIGATMLLDRAERELPGFVQRFGRTTMDVASAATGYATFTIEKAIWIGKGLGALGAYMRKVRTSRFVW